MLTYSLGAPDVHWLSLKPELEGLIVPSKFYGIAAAGKPMIVIADKNGELARLVQEHGCGVAIEPGDVGALVGALLRLSSESGTIKKWAFGREKCWMRTLPGRKHSSDGARCSISWNNFASDDIEQECRLFN